MTRLVDGTGPDDGHSFTVRGNYMPHFATLFVPLALVAGMPAMAQTYATGTAADGGTTMLFTIQPSTNIAAADYVKLSADALNYRIAADKLAITKAQRDDVKGYARSSLGAAQRQAAALNASLANKDRKITKPSTRLSAQRQASLDLLKKTPARAFDNLYLQQVADTTPGIWALQKGYSVDGSDPVLRQVATVAVSPIERGYVTARGLTPTALTQ